MKISDLLKGVPLISSQGPQNKEIVDIQTDSRKVGKGSLFVAIKGLQVDGHSFIDKAIANGAAVIVCEVLPQPLPETVYVLQVENSRRELAAMAANFYGRPAEKITMVGITGTNGKSTSVNLLFRLFTKLGYQCGLLSTIVNRIGDQEIPATHTTPDPVQLHQLLSQMVEAGCDYCFMEVSSHALVQHRTTGIDFSLAMFTNITHDHINYHGSFQEYILAKKLLFDHLPGTAVALLNADDKHSKVMVQNSAAKIVRFGLKRMVEYRARLIENTFEGLLLEIDQAEVWFRLTGQFNAYNLLMVFAAALELGQDKEEVLQVLSGIEGADGRFQLLHDLEGKRTAIVDYAHTPDALKNVLKTIADINQTQGQIITVVGCGGNRDKEKRPQMAHIATSFSSRVILTSDNPRNEDPEEILNDMYAGVPAEWKRKVLRIENRREAIRTACALAKQHDIILVAGKGHETYQEIQGVRYPFDDREEIWVALGQKT